MFVSHAIKSCRLVFDGTLVCEPANGDGEQSSSWIFKRWEGSVDVQSAITLAASRLERAVPGPFSLGDLSEMRTGVAPDECELIE